MRYVTKATNVKRYEEGLTDVGRYIKEPPADWISNPVGVEKMPTPDGWQPEWPVTHPIGPSANYRVLPQVSGCGVCGMGADAAAATAPATPSPAGNLLGIALAGLALVGVFWYFGRDERRQGQIRRNPRRRRRVRRNLVQGVASFTNEEDAQADAGRKRRAGYKVELEQWSPTKWVVVAHK